MKNQQYVSDLVDRDHAAWIAEYRAFHAAIETLESAYGETVTGKPDDTLDRTIADIGINLTVAVVATLINRFAWDGRISRRRALWAASVDSAFDEQTAVEHWFSTRIHMAHLDQIGDALIKRLQNS